MMANTREDKPIFHQQHKGLRPYAAEFADTWGEILEKGKLQMREKCENAGDIMLWTLVGSPRFHD